MHTRRSNINQSINQFDSNLAAREPDSKGYAVEITDKNSKRNKQCAYMYIGVGREEWPLKWREREREEKGEKEGEREKHLNKTRTVVLSRYGHHVVR